VTRVLPDGKFELSVRGTVVEELADDAAHVLAILRRPGAPALGDRSSPAEVRTHLGLSKKAFKRALGRLLRDGAVTLRPDGTATVVDRGDERASPRRTMARRKN
jgi:predicted RNA-binding protein (virulence factor B family)